MSGLDLNKKLDAPINYLLDGIGTLIFLLVVPLILHHYAGKSIALNAIYHGIALGLIIFILDFLGHYAHINPGVTFLRYLLGKHTTKQTLLFLMSQFIAIIIAYILWSRYLYKYIEKL